jgi:crossover junction endodeoxyribonuclease RuvC
MRILGIDPGLQTTGFGVLDATGHTSPMWPAAPSHHHLDSRRPAGAAEGAVRRHLARWCSATEPEVAAVEIVFVNVNPQATLLLGQARGACLTALVSHQLPVAEYTALQMKQAVAGYGKAQQGRGAGDGAAPAASCRACPASDAADALGLAITHAMRTSARAWRGWRR